MSALLELFSHDWAEVWGREVAASESFRAAAVGLQGEVVFAASDPIARAVLIDLDDGACRTARAASAIDRESARFVLGARPRTWKRVILGSSDPLFAILTGRLKLLRGTPAELLPFTDAARELLEAARRVPAIAPADW